MKLNLTTVKDAGIAVRAMRKQGAVRIDDFADIARVSKQFMTDLEAGKPTIQMGRVLDVLNKLGLQVTLELPDAAASALAAAAKPRKPRRAAGA